MLRVLEWLSREHWLVGTSMLRIALGLWAVYYYILHFPVRRLLWGPDGLWPYTQFSEIRPFLNLYQPSGAPVLFDAVYVAGIAVAAAVTLGAWTRLTVPLHWLWIWSLQERNPFVTDGGDNVMRIVLLFMVLTNAGARWSIDAVVAPRFQSRPFGRAVQAIQAVCEATRPSLAVMHNFGVLLILAQLSMLYMSTGLYKAMGELWQQGTALYYILRVHEFSTPGLAEPIYRNPYLVVAGTYGTVLFEVMFFPALFNRWTRYATIGAGLVFHAGIGVVMGLMTFAWSMLSLYPLLVTDEEYVTMGAWLRRRFGLKVFYDGWCPACTRSVRWLSRLDVLSLVDFISIREPWVVGRYGLDPNRAVLRIQSLGPAGSVREGMDAMIAIAARAVTLWPLLPVLWLGRLLMGQRPYDAVAARRLILIPGHCPDHCAVDLDGDQPAADSPDAAQEATSGRT